MKTLQQFYEVMEHTREVRVAMVEAHLAGQKPDSAQVAELRRAPLLPALGATQAMLLIHASRWQPSRQSD